MKKAIGLALAACAWSALGTATVRAQDTSGAPSQARAETEQVGQSLHMTMASGTPSQYFFRGLLQNDKGFNGQANANLDVALYDSKKLQVIVPVGFWFSIQPGNQAKGGKGPAAWYESRFSGGLALANDYFRADLRGYVYSSPNGSFRDVYELDFVGELHDDAWWTRGNSEAVFRGIFPTITLASEVKGARDGHDSGTFLELRAAPRARLFSDAHWTLEVATPIALGMSLHDYYQIRSPANGAWQNHALGYASLGGLLDVAPVLIPKRLGLYHVLLSFDALFPTASKDVVAGVNATELIVQLFSQLRF